MHELDICGSRFGPVGTLKQGNKPSRSYTAWNFQTSL
jgi:hypothetical protein